MVTSGWWKYLRRWRCPSALQRWWWQWRWRCWQWRWQSNDADKGRLRLIPSLPWLSLSHTITSHPAPHFTLTLYSTYQHHHFKHFLLLTLYKHHLTPPHDALTYSFFLLSLYQHHTSMHYIITYTFWLYYYYYYYCYCYSFAAFCAAMLLQCCGAGPVGLCCSRPPTAISVVFVMSAFYGLVPLLIVPMIPATKTTQRQIGLRKHL